AIASGATAPRGGARPSGEGVLVKARTLVNHWIEVALEPSGALALHDRRSGLRFTDLLRVEDGGDAGDTYSYCPPAGDRVPSAAYPLETPVRTAPAHRFVAAASGPRGIALLAPGFFEYEWTPGGDLVYTLLRSVGELSRADLPTRPGHAGWPTATPLAQCL